MNSELWIMKSEFIIRNSDVMPHNSEFGACDSYSGLRLKYSSRQDARITFATMKVHILGITISYPGKTYSGWKTSYSGI